MSLFMLAALVAFIIVAVLAFLTSTGVIILLGITAIGLACLTVAGHGPRLG
jgi:hypothetical protein